MQTKVIIENGKTKIVLTPENDFESDIIEKIYNKSSKFTINTDVFADYNYGNLSDQRIQIRLDEIKDK